MEWKKLRIHSNLSVSFQRMNCRSNFKSDSVQSIMIAFWDDTEHAGRKPSMEDNLHWKTTFDGCQSMM